MSTLFKRYQDLRLAEFLPKLYRYPIACKELSFILRQAYAKLPKNLQAIIFQDTLTAFRLLPEMQTHQAVTTAHLLFQSVEAALPKQKRNLAIKEFKQAMVAHKRRKKVCQEGYGSSQLPHDVLIEIFSFLDMQSLVCVGLVCWSWNFAANDIHLWKSQYCRLTGKFEEHIQMKSLETGEQLGAEDNITSLEGRISRSDIEWKEEFKRAYTGALAKKWTANRGFCRCCNTIVWLCNGKCPNMTCTATSETENIKPLGAGQVVEYLLDDCISMTSSDSDTDSDEGPGMRLWAYPRHQPCC